MSIRRVTIVAFAGLAAALAPVAAADARPSERTTETLNRDIPVFVACPGFPVRGEFEIVRELTTFFDQASAPVKRIVRVEIVGTLSNALTGSSLPTAGVRIFHHDLATGELFTTGSNNVTRLPGGGTSIPGAGRLVFDAAGRLVDHSGPDSAAELGQLCAALAAS